MTSGILRVQVPESEKQVGQLRIATGVIPVDKIKPFEMLVWRVCHGVAFLRLVHIAQTLTDPDTGSYFPGRTPRGLRAARPIPPGRSSASQVTPLIATVQPGIAENFIS